MNKKILFLIIIGVLSSSFCWGQLVFLETMNGNNTDPSISYWETNNLYDNNDYTMSGNGVMSELNRSEGYFQAMGDFIGNCNMLLASKNDYFQIEGINTIGHTGLKLSFGVKKSTTDENGSRLEVSYSTDGTTWIDYDTDNTIPTGVGSNDIWHYVTLDSEVLPETSTLYIKFYSRLFSGSISIDDIRLSRPVIIVESYDLSAYGDTALVCGGINSYLFSIEAISTEIDIDDFSLNNTHVFDDFDNFFDILYMDYETMTGVPGCTHPNIGPGTYTYYNWRCIGDINISDGKLYFMTTMSLQTDATDGNTLQTSAITCSDITYSVNGPTPDEIDNASDGMVYTIKRPHIISPTTTLSGFEYIETTGPSEEQSFTIKGDYLCSDITLTAPTNYEISETSGTGFTNSITLTQTANKVATRTFYVRLKAGLSPSTYNEDVVASCTYGVSKTISCNGIVYKPTINISETALNGFEYFYTEGPSTSQSYTVDGVYLLADILISAPANYEISEDNSSFASSISLSPTANTVASTTIYTRLKSDLSPNEYNSENISLTSIVADNKSIECNGNVFMPKATNLTVGCKTNNSAEISWTEPTHSYDGVIISIRDDNTNPPHEIINGTDPTSLNANADFGSGTEIGIAEPPSSFIAYKGTGTSLTITGLTSGETYQIKAYAYLNSYWSDDSDCPVATIDNIYVPQVTAEDKYDSNTESQLYWSNPTNGCYDEIMIVCKLSSSVSATPSGDGSVYTANANFGLGTDIGTSEFVVYKGTGTTATVSNLTNGETYYVKIFTRKGAEWSDGVELVLNPIDCTVFETGDLAILSWRSNNPPGKEFTFVSFVDITVGTTIDFTDNGWQEENAGSWGTSEGAIRLKRTAGGILPAGTSITVVRHGAGNTETDFEVYVNGFDENSISWSIEMLNTTQGAGFNPLSADDLWLMQGGAWLENDVSIDPTNDDDTYKGKILFGLTSDGWGVGSSISKSDLYPECDCFNIDISGLSDTFRAKYTGSFTNATKLEWITRINNVSNWTSYSSEINYDAGTPLYRQSGVTITINAGDFVNGRWTSAQDTDWFDCANWQDLTVPDENTDVTISDAYSSDNVVINNVSNAICHNLTIESTRNVDLSANTIEIHGDFLNQSAGLTTTGSTIIFAATESVNITTNSISTSLNNVTFNGTGPFNLQDDLIIGGNLSLANGIPTTGSNRINIQNSATNAISGYSATAYINGNLRRAVTPTGSYDFPIGTASNYELVNINLNSSTGLTYLDASFDETVSTIDISALDLTVNGTQIQDIIDGGFWTVSPNAGITAVDYNAGISLTGYSNAGIEPGQHSLIKRDNSSSDWGLYGVHDNSTQSISEGTLYALRTNINSFSDFAIAKHKNNVLPIDLVYFDIKCNEESNLLSWTTASEINNDYFEVQVSTDASKWTVISKVPGAGNSNQNSTYTYIDKTHKNKAYYRLNQVDYEGKNQYFKIVQCDCFSNVQKTIDIYPNPSQNFVNIDITNWHADYIKCEIFDLTGRLLLSKSIQVDNGQIKDIIDISNFVNGLYHIHFSSSDTTITGKFEKKK